MSERSFSSRTRKLDGLFRMASRVGGDTQLVVPGFQGFAFASRPICEPHGLQACSGRIHCRGSFHHFVPMDPLSIAVSSASLEFEYNRVHYRWGGDLKLRGANGKIVGNVEMDRGKIKSDMDLALRNLTLWNGVSNMTNVALITSLAACIDYFGIHHCGKRITMR